jgi:hypothetical protein
VERCKRIKLIFWPTTSSECGWVGRVWVWVWVRVRVRVWLWVWVCGGAGVGVSGWIDISGLRKDAHVHTPTPTLTLHHPPSVYKSQSYYLIVLIQKQNSFLMVYDSSIDFSFNHQLNILFDYKSLFLSRFLSNKEFFMLYWG